MKNRFQVLTNLGRRIVLVLVMLFEMFTSTTIVTNAQYEDLISLHLNNILANYNLVDGGDFFADRVEAFLEDHPSLLVAYGFDTSQAAEVSDYILDACISMDYRINPRVILTIMALNKDAGAANYMHNFDNWVHITAMSLWNAYVAYDTEAASVSIPFPEQTFIINRDEVNSETYALVLVLSEEASTSDMWRTWISRDTKSFYEKYWQLFDDPLASQRLQALTIAPFLYRPWNTSHHPSVGVNSWFDHQYPLDVVGYNCPSAPPPPVDGKLTKYTGEVFSNQALCKCNLGKCYDRHDAIDYDLRTGSEVYPAANGRIVWLDPIMIDHRNGYFTLYGHLNENSGLKKYQEVTRSTLLGTVNAHYNHLHFEVSKGWKPVTDPYGWCSDSVDPWAQHRNGTSSSWLWADMSQNCPNVPPPDTLPSLSFNQANAIPITTYGQSVHSNNPDWTFSGTASDDQGVDHVDYRAWGNNGNITDRASGTISWSYTRYGLIGHNRIHFLAYDAQGQRNPDNGSDSNNRYYIDLYVDAEDPVTNYSLSGIEGNNGWYRSSVQVTLNAEDQGSGGGGSTHGIPNHYKSGIDRVYYRIDGGNWQYRDSHRATFDVGGEGIHWVEYYAVDDVGNVEAAKSFPLRIDTIAPTMPSAAEETHGVTSGEWQRDFNDPAFTWPAATDAGSGVAGYFFEWPNASGMLSTPSYDPSAVRTGSYPLRVQAFDQAGNPSDVVTLFTFNYDGTPPPAPSIENLDGVASGICQNQVRTANFRWPTPDDAGSGVKGYYRYWGANATGISNTLITSNTFASATPFCAEDDACTRYLRVRSEDNVGWQSSDWATFVMRYDGVSPTAQLTANYGQPVAHQTSIHLDISASDLGCGVTQMRLSNSGYNWSDWMPLTDELYWEIPALGRRNHDIYLQVQDAAQNLSTIISDTVYFDVNVPQPESENYRLWDSLMPAGSGIITSTSHVQRVTVGQPSVSAALYSDQYLLNTGFQAGALAAPIQVPTYTSYIQLGSLMASATTSATALSSAQYNLYGSLGQPSDMHTVTSTHFVADLGFWAGAASDVVPQPPEPPEPPIPPECEFYSLSINNGALFTRSPLVNLNLCGPDPEEMMLSNDGGFGGATWQPYTTAISWTLTTYGDTVLPRFVYGRYKDTVGSIYGNFVDDIIYDPNAPTGMAAFDPSDLQDITLQQDATARFMALGRPRTLRTLNTTETELYLSASDDSSGLSAIQISRSSDFSDATWQPFTAIVPVTFTGDGTHTVYVRTRDEAGNVSADFSDSVIVDTTPPALPPTSTLQVVEEVVGTGALTLTLAVDNAPSDLEQVRVSYSPAFTDTLWITHTNPMVVPARYTGALTPTLYVQFRDAAGNASQTYTTTYRVDVAPPYGEVDITALQGTQATLQFTVDDYLSPVTRLWLSPDFWFFSDVTVMPYQDTLAWDFGDTDELYIMFEDAAGNISWPYWISPEIYEPADNTVYLPLVVRQD